MTEAVRRSLELIYFNFGGGHRNAAEALQASIAVSHPNWDVKLVNLCDVLQPIDPMYRLRGRSSEGIYNQYLKKDWTYGSGIFLRLIQTGISLYAAKMEPLLEQHWRNSSSDLVVSLIPNFNRVMFRALRRAQPKTPYVTVMTDLADLPSHFWQERQAQFLICGSDRAAHQALAQGYSQENVFQTSGMPIKPRFYDEYTIDRQSERGDLGLDPNLPTALIMFGGNGSKAAVKIVDQLNRSGLAVQSIVMCGHSDELRQELQSRKYCHALGFTKDVQHYMRLADFFIGKPGPGSVSEALHMGLPVITEKNLRTLKQERWNAIWLREEELGIVVKNFRRQIVQAVGSLLENGRLEQLRDNARHLPQNRAVYEIPERFQQIMDSAESPVLRQPGLPNGDSALRL